MFSPYALPPIESAQKAARTIIDKVHAYMRAHAESELHRCGKMFGVLVVRDRQSNESYFIAAFSAQLDGSYYHEGFVPPIYAIETPPIGHSQQESRRLQKLLFANYEVVNGKGDRRNLLDIFSQTAPILSKDEYFSHRPSSKDRSASQEVLPPAGSGECCAPKLLQYALTHNLEPIGLAEFWVGAVPRNEIRREGVFYAPCSGRCVPILNYMLQGIDVAPTKERIKTESLCSEIRTIYEDEYLMVVNKPSGILSVPGKNESLSLVSYLVKEGNYDYLEPAHRLDQDTSGLLVLAKRADVYRQLQSYFQRRDILKRYEAIIEADTIAEEGIIDLPLLPNPYDRPRQMVDRTHGKDATTRYIVRERRTDGTILIDFYPQTGRTHQLRIHAAHPEGLNAPIVGDRLYGGRNADRLMLHAAELEFMHPITQERMHFCIPSQF